MKALNKAFEKALAHSESNNNLMDLLSCMGEEMACERISIFEENESGLLSNTYEWCRPGIVREQIRLQQIPVEKFDTWQSRLISHETIVIRSPEELLAHDPDVYAMFLDQGICRALVTLLAFQGRNFGFCILENPAVPVMQDYELIMPGIRYILSSMLYSRNLINRLRKLGYTDSLTGVGNRVSMYEYCKALPAGNPLGIICVDVIGWDDAKDRIPHLEREQTLLRAAGILSDLFDEERIFRVATGEFMIVENDVASPAFGNNLRAVRSLLLEHNLLSAVSGEWQENDRLPVSDLIHTVHKAAENEKRALLMHRAGSFSEDDSGVADHEKARIDLLSGDAFFRAADRFLAEIYDSAVVTIVTDVNYFKLYNDIFGRRSGNIFLENIAGSIRKAAEENHGICGYTGGDNFCLIMPTAAKEADEILPLAQRLYTTLEFPDGFYPAMGVYYSNDRRETMIALYDKASTALAEVKGDYINHICLYNAVSHHHQLEDKLILLRVKEGLSKGEFVFHIQPQVHEPTGKIIGGEALVRWNRDGQMIPPARFIPLLEKTGYIYAVDSFVWNAVAGWQRSLLDRGIRPVPVSVNVSRVDFYFDDIARVFIDLIHKYDLDPGLIGVEITESAFTDNTDAILDAIRRLHEAGFHIMMDDFGSGSSSLSMLHTLNLDVLKTDVQFMSKDDQDNRALSIVEFVISMAHMIGMSVITEGVETETQKENLIALGDNYAQGFYFYEPMPAERFEALIRNSDNVGQGYKKTDVQSVSRLRFKDMIREGLVSETLLHNIIRAAAIYREEDNEIFILQINPLYTELTGISLPDDCSCNLKEFLEAQELEKMRKLMKEAGSHPLGGSEGSICIRNREGDSIVLKMRLFMLYSLDNHRLYLSTMG